MIVTLTLNPAVDKTILVRNMAVGEVHRVRESYLDPAGKGINVARVADRLGWPAIAFGFLAGETGQLVSSALEEEGVQSQFVRVPGHTRLNVTVFDEASGQGTSFYDQGPEVSSDQLKRLEDEMRPWLLTCRVLVLAGSLPPGVPADIYARFIALARATGVKSVLDADGEALHVGASARPYLIKPNLQEAERLVGQDLPDLTATRQAARGILAGGVESVVISMGAQGALAANGDRMWLAIPPKIRRRSTVGSGDSMVAGLAVALGQGKGMVEALILGTAAGAATAMVAGSALATPLGIARLLPKVRIQEL